LKDALNRRGDLLADWRELKGRLSEFFSDAERVAVVGVGSEFRGDDFVGVKVVRELSRRLESERVLLIDGENAPENQIDKIVDFRPTHVLVVDAGMVGLKPGQPTLVDAERLTAASALSTHALSLRVFCELVKEIVGAEVAVLVIQPKDANLRCDLTSELNEASKYAVEVLLEVLNQLRA